jgi:hypothetical protein
MQNLGADFVIKAFNAISTPAVSAGADESAPASAVDASSTPESVLAPTSVGPVAYTVPYPSSNESSSASTTSSSSIESLPAPSSDLASTPCSEPILVPTSVPLPAPTSESPPAPIAESPPAPVSHVESIPTSVLGVAESSAAQPSSSPNLPSASPVITDVPESSSQSGGPARTRCQ